MPFQKLKYFTKYSQNLKTYQYLDQHPTYSTKMKQINRKNIDIGILTSYHTTDKCVYNTSEPHFTIKQHIKIQTIYSILTKY